MRRCRRQRIRPNQCQACAPLIPELARAENSVCNPGFLQRTLSRPGAETAPATRACRPGHDLAFKFKLMRWPGSPWTRRG